jgi:hypothetical protein
VHVKRALVEALLEPPVDISREVVQHPDTHDGI